LQVKILPTVICFIDGVAVHNIIGFDGLTAGLPPDKLDEWPLSNLARELALAKVFTPLAVLKEDNYFAQTSRNLFI
ncbi:unnamed protein product, partial [Ectocarpus sp. 13 AM-2016]